MDEQNLYEDPDTADTELIGILVAISVTSKNLAAKLIRLSQTEHSQKGGEPIETV